MDNVKQRRVIHAVLIYDALGKLFKEIAIKPAPAGAVSICATPRNGKTVVELSTAGAKSLLQIDLESESTEAVRIPELTGIEAIYPSAFENKYWADGPAPLLSQVQEFSAGARR